MKHRGMKILSLLLTLALVLGLLPGIGLTAYAAPTETPLTTITATAKEQASYSTANVATVSFSYTAGGSSAYLANWGWWGYGWSATVNAAEGYTITKCVFYDNENRTATDSSSPFVVETTEENKTPKVNGTILADNSKGITKIEVYGYATPAHTHDFTYSASGATITATCNGAGTCDITEGLTLTISAPTGNLVYNGTTTYPAVLSTGYNTTAFPGTYSISYTKDGSAYSGVPKDAGTYTASVTAGTGDGAKTASVSYTIQSNRCTVTYNPGAGSGEVYTQTPEKGSQYKIEAFEQYYTAPNEEKTFGYWLGSDNRQYTSGSSIPSINSDLILTAQWKDKDKPQGGGSQGGDVVFYGDFGGGDESWSGGYVTGLRAYRVSLAPMQGGSAALVLNTGESGETMNVYPQTTVRVVPSPAPGYKLASIVWSLIDGSASYDITQAQNLVMPAMDVVVHVTFAPVG